MAKTFMDVCNNVLNEMNEVLLTQSTFSGATNVQAGVKNFVNRAYMDVNNPEYRWPWLSVGASIEPYYGNVELDLVPGQRWYLINSSSTDVNTDYSHIDWENVFLTSIGVSGETAPYEARRLHYVELDEWVDHFEMAEVKASVNGEHSIPHRVIKANDRRRIGFSPLPDKAYKVYFYAWTRPVELTLYNDPIVLPDQYMNVLIARARYFAWQRKENVEQAAIALEDYKVGLRGMKHQEINSTPDGMTDDRVRYI